MTRVTLNLDQEGPASFEELIEYVEDVLRQNFVVIPEKNIGTHDPYKRRARNIVMSILSRLDIERPYQEEEVDQRRADIAAFYRSVSRRQSNKK